MPCDDTEQLNRKLHAARQLQELWRTVPLHRRASLIAEVARLLDERALPICQTISQEMGKPVVEALQTDILSAVSSLQHLARQGTRLLRPRTIDPLKARLMGRTFKVHRIPHGVVAVISPWNYPVATPATAIGSALLAGNTVIFKPSELTPRSGLLLAEAFGDVLARHNLPRDICQVIIGDRDAGRALIESGQIDFAFFTGSERAGRWIQQEMAAQGKGCTLELGGSDAMIVLPTARDRLEDVTRYAVWGRFANAGQTCAAVKRLVVHHSLYPALLQQLRQSLAALRVGDPADRRTHIGPVASQEQKALLEAQLKDAISDGADVWQVPLPTDVAPTGAYFPLTLVTGVSPASRLWQEEVFGPVLAIWPYHDTDELKAHTVDSPYGLGLSIFGDTSEVRSLLKLLGPNTSGHIAINDLPTTQYAFPILPWSGLKGSGPGVRNGEDGLLEMTRLQVVGGQDSPMPAPWLFRRQSPSWRATLAMVRLMTRGHLGIGLIRYFLQK